MKKTSSSGAVSDRTQPPSRGRSAGGLSQLVKATSTRLEVLPPPPSAFPGAARPAAGIDLLPVRLGYFQPDAHAVFVVGSFNGWNRYATPMTRDALGDWSVELALPRGEHRYRLLVDGEWRDDPTAQMTAPNPYGGFDALIVL